MKLGDTMKPKLFLIPPNSSLESFTYNNDEIYAEIQFNLNLHYCKRCGKPLVDIKSIENEMGPTCYLVSMEEKRKHKCSKLF